jgi:hypothetical protein
MRLIALAFVLTVCTVIVGALVIAAVATRQELLP